MFEVSPNSSHTGAQPSTPLIDCLVNDMLLQTKPCSNRAPLQINNIEYGPLMGDIWNTCFDNMNSILRVTASVTRLSSDVTIGLLCGDLIFDAVRYAVKVV